MILPVHASLLRIETIRLLLATGHEKTEVAEKFGVTRQAIYSAIDRFDLERPLQPFNPLTIRDTPYLAIAAAPAVAERLIKARIIETLLGY